MTASSNQRQVSRPPGEQGAAAYLLTPSAQAALLGLNMFQANLRIWRGLADSMRDSMRSQQDAMMRMLLDRSSANSEGEGTGVAATASESVVNGATDFFMPVLAARRAYVQMSGAMIDAQRQALAALVQGPRPH